MGWKVGALFRSNTNRWVWGAVALGLLALSARTAQAAAVTWTGSLDSTWDNTGNWSTGAMPLAGDVAVFNGAEGNLGGISLDGANRSVAGLQELSPSGDVTIAPGNTLNLGTSGIDMSASTHNFSINCNVSLTGPQSWNVNTGTTLTVGGGLSGTSGLTKLGGGTLTLGGSNTGFSGPTTIGSAAAGGGAIQINNGAALQNSAVFIYGQGPDTWAQAIQFAFGVTSATFASLASSGKNPLPLYTTANTPLTATGSVTLTVGGNNASTTFSGAVWGTGTLVKAGSGMLTFNDSSGNDWCDYQLTGAPAVWGGSIVLAGGVVSFNSVREIPQVDTDGLSSLIFSGGTMQYTAADTDGWNMNHIGTAIQGANFNGGLDITQAVTIVPLSAQLTGTGSFSKAGAGTVILYGQNSYTGGTTLSAGSLQLENTYALGAVGPLMVSGGTLDLCGYSPAVGAISGAGTITNSSPSSSILRVSQSLATTFSGTLQDGAGTFALTKSGTGMLTLTGSNNYSGGTTVSGGTVFAVTNTALGAGTDAVRLSFSAGLVVSSPAPSIGSLAGNPANTVVLGNAAANAATVLTIGGNNSSTIFAGTISDQSALASGAVGSLIKVGSGMLTLSGSNTYQGGTTLVGGELVMKSDASIGGPSTALSFNGGILQVAGTSLANLDSHTVNWSSFNGGFDVATPVFTVSEMIGGTGSLTKLGAGLLILSGSNSFSGPTTIGAAGAPAGVGFPIGGVNAQAGGGIMVGSSAALQNSAVSIYGGGPNLQNIGVVFGPGVTTATFASLASTPFNGSDGSGPLSLMTTDATPLPVNLTVGGNNTSTTWGGAIWSYTASGATSLSLAGTLTKVGSGTLYVDDTAGNDNNSWQWETGLPTVFQGVYKLQLNGGEVVYNSVSFLPGFRNPISQGTSGAIGFNGGMLGINFVDSDAWDNQAISNEVVGGNFNGGFDTIQAGETLSLATQLTGTGSFTKAGAGTVILSGQNTYTGGTILTAGSLQLGSSSGLGGEAGVNGPLTLSGGTLDLNGYSPTVGALGGAAGTITNSSAAANSTLTVNQSVTTTFSGTLADGAMKKLALSINGAGLLILSGTNTNSGGTTVNQGTLEAAGTASLPGYNTANAVSVAGGAVLAVQLGNGSTGWNSTEIGSPTQSGSLLGSVTWSNTTAALGIDTGSTGNATYAGNLAMTAGLTKLGANNLTLTGSNTYSGVTTVSAGGLSVASTAALPGYKSSNRISVAAGAVLAVQPGNGTTGWSSTQITTLLGDVHWSSSTAAFGIDTTNGNYSYSGGTTQGLAKLGANTLTLTGSNPYTGTQINAGALNINGDRALGAVSAPLTFTGNGTLQAGAAAIVLNSGRNISINSGVTATVDTQTYGMTINGAIGGAGGLTKLGASTLTLGGSNSYTGATTLSGGTLQFSSAASQALSGAISGGGALAMAGPGTLTLSGSNGYSGGTVLSGGLLSAAALNDTAGSNLGASGQLTLTGGTLQYSGTGTTDSTSRAVQASSATLQVANSAANLTFNGAVDDGGGSNPYSLAKTGSGALTLGGSANNVGLMLSVVQGTLTLAKTGSSGHAASSVANVSPGAVLQLGGSNWGGQIGTSLLSMNGTFNLNGMNEGLCGLTGAGTVTNSASSTTSTLTFGYVPNGASGGTSVFAGAIADGLGAMALSVSGGGTLTLTGTGNAYSGGTTIYNGMLQIGDGVTSPGSLPGSVVISSTTAGALTFNTPVLMSLTSSGNISGSGSGGLTKSGAGLLTLSGSNSFSGATTLSAGNLAYAALSAVSSNSSILISGPGAVNVGGAYPTVMGWLNSNRINPASTGVLALSGSSSETIGMAGYNSLSLGAVAGGATYSGSLTPAGATYRLGGGGGALSVSTALTNGNGLAAFGGGAGGTLILTGNNSYSGGTTIGSGGLLVFNSAASQVLNGAISGGGSLTQQGPGTLTLGGSNTYSGVTTLSGGGLAVNGPLTVSAVNVDAAAVLSGTGSVGNLIHVWGGGILAPGNSVGGGTLTAASLTLESGGILNYTLGNAGFLNVPGAVTLANGGGQGTLNLYGNGVGAGTYPLFSYGSLNIAPSSALTIGVTPASLAGDSLGLTTSGNVVDLVIVGPSGGTWNTNGSGVWSTSSNWSGGVPGSGQGTAVFGPVLATGTTATVTLDGSQSLSSLGFSTTGGAGYVISGSGGSTLTLAGTGAATISSGGGNNAINVPITLASGLSVSTSAGSVLTIGQAIGESGGSQSLSLSGNGELILSGTDTYTGGTDVSGGTLEIVAGSALAGGGSVTISGGGALVFGSGPGSGSPLAASSPIGSDVVASTSAVPEPAALVLLLVAGLGGLAVVLITSTNAARRSPRDAILSRRIVMSRRVGPDRVASAGPPLSAGKHIMVGLRSLRDLVPPYSRNATEGVPYKCHRRFLRLEPLEDRSLLSTTWYVATTGSNSNAGTSLSAPFQTIQQAASVAQAGDTVYICAGTYHETVTPANSGTAGASITYEPYNGGSVVVDGADPVTGWTLYNSGASGPIYQATMNWSYNNGDGDQVFVDGQMMNYARWPNSSLDVSNPTRAVSATASYTVGSPMNTGVYTDAALDAFAANYWVGATIHFVGGWDNGEQESGTVTASAPGSVTFSYIDIGAEPTAGNSFYLDGLFKGLDASAQWYLNASSDTLYLWTPTGDSPANHTVEAKARTFGFELSGLSYINIQGIRLFACSIDTSSTSTHDTINAIQALYVSSFEQESASSLWPWLQLHMQDTGIIVQGSCNILENSEIGYSAGNGVTLMGNNTSFSTGNVVTNNVIHDVDYMALDCAGVNTGNGGYADGPGYGEATSTFNTISDNTIYNSGRDLIIIRNLGSGVVDYNNLYNAMLQTADGGAIYADDQNGKAFNNNSNPDTVVAYNCIHDNVAIANTDGWGEGGLYFDNNSRNYVVDHNLVYDTDSALNLGEATYTDDIYLNTVIGFQNDISSGPDLPGSILEDNLCVGALNLPGFNWGTGGSADNIFSGAVPSLDETDYAYTPPDFVNPAALDFQLQSTSPAVNSGMVIPGYTNGYVGAAPDAGCFEYGATPWTAGASAASNAYAADIPAAPLDLAATSPGPLEIDLTWQNSDANATCCVIQRSTADPTPQSTWWNGMAFTTIALLPGNATSYADTTLITGTYDYRVSIENGSYLSGYSNYVTANSAPVPFVNTIQAASFTAASGATASGGVLTNCSMGNWAEYANVNFPAGVNSAGPNTSVNQLTVCYSSTAAGGNGIEFLVDSLSGPGLGTVTTQEDPSGSLITSTITFGDLVWGQGEISAGLHNVYLVFADSGSGGMNVGNGGQDVANISWFRFSSLSVPALQQTWAGNFTGTGGATGGVGSDDNRGIASCDNGDWVQYADIYVPAGANQVTLNYTDANGSGDTIELSLDSPTNPIIAQDSTQPGYGSSAGSDTVGVSGITAGLHDVYIEFVQNGSGPSSNICDLSWFQFSDSSTVAAPTGATATPAAGLAMNVSWTDNSNNETGFKIERSTDGKTFIQVGTVGANVTNFQDTGLASGTTYYYRVCAFDQDYGNSAYSNVVSVGAQAFDLYWSGGGGTWNGGGSGWLNSNSQAVAWANGYVAVFNSGSGGTMTVSGTVSAAEIDFETSGYSLSGGSITLPYAGGVVRVDAAAATIASPITGGSLTKSGAGQLTLSGSSSYSGQTNVLVGTLTVNGSLATGGTLLVQSGATLTGGGSVGSVTVAPGATLAPGNNGSGNFSAASVQVDSGCTLDYTLGTGVSGSDGLVTVTGQLGLYAGDVLNVTAGANWGNGMYPLFYLPNTNFPTPTTINAGWTIAGANLGGHIYSLVATGNDVDLDVQAVGGVWSASGGGTFSWGTGGNWLGGIAPNGAGDTALFGTAVGSGTATITPGSAQTVSGLTFSPAAGGSYALSGSGGNSLQLANGGSSASISVTGGSDAINAPIVLDDNVNVTTVTGSGLSISGAISQSGSHALTLSGSGIVTLSGSDSYTGGTTVNGGTLAVNNTAGSGTGTGPVAINGTGTLSGNGTINGAASIGSGGSLAPGNGGIGALTINNTLALAGGAAVNMEIDKTTSGSDLVQGLSTVTYGGTLNVTNLAGTLAPGDTFTLFAASSYAGNFATFNLPALAAGLSWNTSKLTVNGSISVMNVTSLATAFATGVYGGTTTATATLTSTFTSSPVAGKTISFSLNNVSLGTATTNSSGVATLIGISLSGYNAGTYTSYLVASFAGDTTYTGSSAAANLTVNPAALTITASPQGKTYGAALGLGTTAFTTSGLVNSDTVTDVTLSSDGAAATAAVSGSPYTITPSAATGSGLGNYTITYNTGTLTLNPATLTITADNKTMDCGTALPDLTASYSGFVNGETSASLTTQPILTTTATSSSPAGSYDIDVSGAVDANYSISYVTGTLTVTPIATVATWNSAADGPWNWGPNWSDTQGVGTPGFSGVSGDQATFNGAAGLNVDLGNFSPSIAGLTFGPGALNYDIKSTGSGQLQLNNGSSDAAITVSAGSQTIDAPVVLANNVNVTAAGGAGLTISGAIGQSGGSQALTLAGSGSLTLSSTNGYTGGTTVNGGTLLVTNSGALPSGTALTVGAGGTVVFGSSLGAASQASAPTATVQTAPVVSASPRTTFDAAQGDTGITASGKQGAVPAVLKTSTIVVAGGGSGAPGQSVASAAPPGGQVHDARHAAALVAMVRSEAWTASSGNATWLEQLPSFQDWRHPAWNPDSIVDATDRVFADIGQ